MTGDLLALGASHKTAPLALREKLALPAGRAARVLGELTDHDGVHEAVAPVHLQPHRALPGHRRRAGGGEHGARDPLPAGRAAPDRADRLALLAARPRGGGAPVLGHRRARLDDRRRGRDPGAGQARLRDGAGRGRQRPRLQPALPRRARRRQAVRTETGVARSNVSISTVAVQLASDFLGELADRRVLVIGAGENAELTARALRDRGVHTCSSPTAATTARSAWRSVRRPRRDLRGHAARARGGRHRRHLHRRAAPDRRPRGAGVRRRVAHGPPTGDDRPGRAARHRAERARLPRHRALRHGRPPARGGPQPRRPRGRGRGGARARAPGRGALRGVARQPRRRARRSRPCAGAPTRSSGRCSTRTSRAGSRSRRPTASASR